MTVPTNSRRRTHICDGVTTQFNGPMAYGRGDIAGFLSKDGVITPVNPASMTVERLGRETGSRVTITPAPADGYVLTLVRDVPYNQETDITNQGAFLPETLEKGMDLLSMQIQQLDDRQMRSLLFADQVPLPDGFSPLLPLPVGLAPLVWKADRTGLENGDANMTGDMLLRPNLSDTQDPAKGAALVGFNDKAAPAFLKTVSDILNGVPVDILRNIPKSRWAGIQNGTDTEDCADAIMALMDGAFNARVAQLRLPVGRFTIHKPIQRLAGSAPFRLVGDDMMRSIIMRGSDWDDAVGTGSVFSISGVDGHSIENLRINGNALTYPVNANHAIACSNSNNVRYRNLYIEDWQNSGILIFHFPGVPAPSAAMEINNVIDQCYLVGNGASNNGILLVDQENSYISRCVVMNIGVNGSPQYALQFKNRCYRCHITDSIAVNARAGVSFGQESVPGVAAEQCSISNVLVKNCVWGIYMGGSGNSIINGIDIDMGGVGSHPVELVDCSGNAITNVKVRGQRTTGGSVAPYTAKFTGACVNNLVEFSSVSIDSASTPRLATLSSESTKNSVTVKHLSAPTTPLIYTGQAVNNENTSAVSGNTVQVAGYPGQESVTISAGVIVLRDARVSILRVNTEASAATDDLDTITGPGIDGQTITLKTTANARDVTVKHGTGNIRLAGGADFALSLINSKITLQWDSAVSFWCEVSRSSNL